MNHIAYGGLLIDDIQHLGIASVGEGPTAPPRIRLAATLKDGTTVELLVSMTAAAKLQDNLIKEQPEAAPSAPSHL